MLKMNLTLKETVERFGVRLAMRAARKPVLKFLGRKPISIDGDELHPEMQLLLLDRELRKIPALGLRPPHKERKAILRDVRVHGNLNKDIVHSLDLEIPVSHGSVKARHYWPKVADAKSLPLLVFLHGGGYVLCNLDTHDIEAGLYTVKAALGFYIGGMGAKGKNFHTDLMARMGYEDEAYRIQDLFFEGKRDEAIALVPTEFADEISLVGPPGRIKERLEVWKDSPVTTVTMYPSSPDQLRQAAEIILS